MWHGTVNGYSNHHCRCLDCRRAWAAYYLDLRRHHAAELVPSQIVHGKDYSYTHWGCRCAACKAAHVAAVRKWRLRKAERMVTRRGEG